MGAFILDGGQLAAELIRSHCVSASMLAQRLGLGQDVCGVLPHAFERWDGKGLPSGLLGEQIALEMRIVQLADIVEVHHRLGGVGQAVAVARGRSGSKFDPEIVDIFCRHADELLSDLGGEDAWGAVVNRQTSEDAELSATTSVW